MKSWNLGYLSLRLVPAVAFGFALQGGLILFVGPVMVKVSRYP